MKEMTRGFDLWSVTACVHICISQGHAEEADKLEKGKRSRDAVRFANEELMQQIQAMLYA